MLTNSRLGKSRSATVVIAYLLQTTGVPTQVLVRPVRPHCTYAVQMLYNDAFDMVQEVHATSL